MQYKKMYQELKRKVADLQYDLDHEEKTVSDLERDCRELKQAKDLKEELIRASFEEINWLRETLRLVIVDKGKMEELSKAMIKEQDMRMQNRY